MYTKSTANPDVFGQSALSQTRTPFVTPSRDKSPIRTKPRGKPHGYRACDLGLGFPSPPGKTGRFEPVSIRRCGPYVTATAYISVHTSTPVYLNNILTRLFHCVCHQGHCYMFREHVLHVVPESLAASTI